MKPRHLAIEVGSHRFVARLEHEAAPRTCAAFLKMLPFSNQVIHSCWSGEAVWVPLADFDTGLDYENHTSHPSRGDVLLHPGGFSETEILFAWSGREMPAMDLRPGLAAVQCPVLVMAGEADPVTPIADAEEIAAAIAPAWCRFERFAGVGHGAWRDDPARAFAVLRDFITAT